MKSMGNVTVSKYKDFYYFYLKISECIWFFKAKMITMASEMYNIYSNTIKRVKYSYVKIISQNTQYI